MAAEPNIRKPTRHPRVLWSRLHYRWPFVVWLGAVAAVGWLYMNTGRTIQIAGAVEVIREEAAPLEAARLTKIHIVQGQQVKAGDLIAEFDTTLLDAEMADIKSDLNADQFEFATRAAELQARYEIDQIQLERQFLFAVNDAELRLRELKFQHASESNRLGVLRSQLRMLDPVLTASAADMKSLVTMRADEESLARTVALYPEMVSLAEADIVRIRAQHEAARNWKFQGNVTNTIAAHERAAAAKDVLAALRKRKEAYVLRANNDGIVSRVLHQVGDVVPAADPIASVVTRDSQHIVAFVPESLVHHVAVGKEVWIARPLQSENLRPAQITALGPEVVTLPTRASPLPGQSVRGRRCTLDMTEAGGYLPGESVAIFLNRPWWVEQVVAVKKYFASR